MPGPGPGTPRDGGGAPPPPPVPDRAAAGPRWRAVGAVLPLGGLLLATLALRSPVGPAAATRHHLSPAEVRHAPGHVSRSHPPTHYPQRAAWPPALPLRPPTPARATTLRSDFGFDFAADLEGLDAKVVVLIFLAMLYYPLLLVGTVTKSTPQTAEQEPKPRSGSAPPSPRSTSGRSTPSPEPEPEAAPMTAEEASLKVLINVVGLAATGTVWAINGAVWSLVYLVRFIRLLYELSQALDKEQPPEPTAAPGQPVGAGHSAATSSRAMHAAVVSREGAASALPIISQPAEEGAIAPPEVEPLSGEPWPSPQAAPARASPAPGRLPAPATPAAPAVALANGTSAPAAHLAVVIPATAAITLPPAAPRAASQPTTTTAPRPPVSAKGPPAPAPTLIATPATTAAPTPIPSPQVPVPGADDPGAPGGPSPPPGGGLGEALRKKLAAILPNAPQRPLEEDPLLAALPQVEAPAEAEHIQVLGNYTYKYPTEGGTPTGATVVMVDDGKVERELAVFESDTDRVPVATDKPKGLAHALVQPLYCALGVGFLLYLETRVDRAATGLGVACPAGVVSLWGLFLVMCALNALSPKLPAFLEALFQPSTAFLSTWLGLFAVPALMGVVPLLNALPWRKYRSVWEMLDLGQLAPTLPVAAALLFVRQLTMMAVDAALLKRLAVRRGGAFSSAELAGQRVQVPDVYFLRRTALLALALAALLRLAPQYATLVRFAFYFTAMSLAYGSALRLQTRLRARRHPLHAAAHPVLLAAVAAVGLVRLAGVLEGVPFQGSFQLFQLRMPEALPPLLAGLASSPSFIRCSPAEVISCLLGPAIASLAFRLWSYRALFLRLAGPLFAASAVFMAGSMTLMAALLRLLPLSHPLATALLLPPVGAPWAVQMAEAVGLGESGLAVAAAVYAAVLGLALGPALWSVLRLRPRAHYAAQGTVGVEVVGDSEEAAAVSFLSMVISGTCAVALCSIPAFWQFLLRTAGM